MKKLISVILALLVMLVPMAGCSKGGDASLTLNQQMINLSLFGGADIIASRNNIDEITWSSDNSAVISMEEHGNYVSVTAIGSGRATVTASGGGKSASCVIVVDESEYALAVSLDRIGDIEINAGSSAYIPAKATYRGQPLDVAKLTYTVEDQTVATVSKDGVITGVNGGETRVAIVAEKDSTRSAPYYVNVIVKAGPVLMLNATYFNLYEYDRNVGQVYYPSSADFFAYIVDGQKTEKNIDLVIENTNDDVAIIEDGLVKSVGAGETMFTITCTYNEQTYVSYLYVYVKAIPKVEVVLTESDVLLYADPVGTNYPSLQALNYTVRVDGKAVSAPVTWGVDAGKNVATVTNKGVIKSIAAGKAVISASYTYNGETYKTTCNVTVIEDLFYGALKSDDGKINTNMVFAYLSTSYPTLKINNVALRGVHSVDMLRIGVPNVNGSTSKIFRLFIRLADANDSRNWIELVYSHFNNGSTIGLGAYAMNTSAWDLKGLVGVGYSPRHDKLQIMASTTSSTYCGAGYNAGKIGVADGPEPLKFKQALTSNYERQMIGLSVVNDELSFNYIDSKGERVQKLVLTKAQQSTLLGPDSDYPNSVWEGFSSRGVNKVNITIRAQMDGTGTITPIMIDTVGGYAVDQNIISSMSLVKA